jgi:membrane protein
MGQTDGPPAPDGFLAATRWWAATLAQQWRDDNLSLIAAGVAFFCLLSLLPAVAAIAGIYGLVAGPERTELPGGGVFDALPTDLRQLVTNQLDELRQSSRPGVTLAAIVAVAVSLWSASAAVRYLIIAIDSISGSAERRSFVDLRVLSVVFTAATVALLVAALGLTAVVPLVVAEFDLPGATDLLLQLLRWPALGLGTVLFAASLYRFAPIQPERFRLFTPGSIVAATIWLLGSVAFSTFVADAGRFRAAYGSLASAVVTLAWFWLFAVALLLGAEVNRARTST